MEQSSVKSSKVKFNGEHFSFAIPENLSLRARQEQIREKLIRWYRHQAQEILGSRIFHCARVVGVEPKKVAVRTQKRIWGSCHHGKGSINLNWLIVLSPIEVIDYVIIHELCHLIVPNHSKKFWQKVESFLKDYRHHERWLKDHSVEMIL